MNKIIILIISLFGCQCLNAQDYQNAINKARFLISQHQQQTQVPGIQVALMVDNTLIWSEGFGYRDLDSKTPMDKATKMRIASISKSVTSVALGKLVDKNTIDLDENINYYLPEFPPKNHPITSRQLAASISGIRHYTDSDPSYNSENYPEVIDSLERFKNDALLFEPGTDYHYSSYGWVLLSAVMEKAAQKPFVKIMQDTWNELGMAHTTFDFPLRDTENTTTHYISGKKNTRAIAPFDNRSYMYAGGGYLSTAEDLVLMTHKLLAEDYISDETRDMLFTPNKLNNGTETKYGLGWESGTNRSNTSVVYHSGSMPSARSHLVVFPEKNIVFAYLANTGDNIFFNEREAHSIAELFLDTESPNANTDILIGEWKIKTTSLRNRKTTGVLKVSENAQGIIQGSITFKRSRKQKTFPIVLAGVDNNQFHLMAVSPMFLDLYLTIEGNNAKGRWLHDFNVNGTPETDDYWDPRTVSAKKKTLLNNETDN